MISGQAIRLPALIKAAEENGAEFLVLDTGPKRRPDGVAGGAGCRPSANPMPPCSV